MDPSMILQGLLVWKLFATQFTLKLFRMFRPSWNMTSLNYPGIGSQHSPGIWSLYNPGHRITYTPGIGSVQARLKPCFCCKWVFKFETVENVLSHWLQVVFPSWLLLWFCRDFLLAKCLSQWLQGNGFNSEKSWMWMLRRPRRDKSIDKYIYQAVTRYVEIV